MFHRLSVLVFAAAAACFCATSSFAGDEIQVEYGVIRDVRDGSIDCTQLPDANLFRFDAYLENDDTTKTCLTLLPESPLASLKYFFGKHVRVEGKICCGYPEIKVLNVYPTDAR